MPKRPNIRTLQMQETIDRQRQCINTLKASNTCAAREIRDWLGNWNADAIDRMRADFVRVAGQLEASISSDTTAGK